MKNLPLSPLAALAVAAAVVVSACTGAGGASPTAPAGDPSAPAPAAGVPTTADLDGRTFLSTAIVGRDLVAGSQVRLVFDGDRLGASAGCNQLGGGYSIADGLLAASQMITTEMACDPALMEQDRWLTELLGGAGVTLADDTLTLERAGVTLTLVDREVADPDRPLEGTRWVVDGVIANDAVSSVPAGVTASITIHDGRVDVEAGCNTGGGSVEVAEGVLTFGPVALTKMACEPDAMAVEQAVVATLTGPVAYSIEADVLTLDGDGVGLTLRAES